jgi:hypothetical protein
LGYRRRFRGEGMLALPGKSDDLDAKRLDKTIFSPWR